jgi:hypothetical protein
MAPFRLTLTYIKRRERAVQISDIDNLLAEIVRNITSSFDSAYSDDCNKRERER